MQIVRKLYDTFISNVRFKSLCIGWDCWARRVTFQICILGPLSTSYETRMTQITSPPPHNFWNLPFCPYLLFPSPSSALPGFFHFLPFADPFTRMPYNPGPWQLDRVKRRLRQEQVDREEKASERYKQQEARLKVQQNTNQYEKRLSVQERNVWGCHWAVVLLVCVLVFLLLVCVLVLCAVVWHLVKKENEQ